MTTKICTSCKKEIDLDLFTRDRSKKDGYYSKCKVCSSQKVKEFYQANPGYKSKADKEYYTKNKDKIIQRQNVNESIKRKCDIKFKLKKNLSRSINFNLHRNFSSKNRKSCLSYLSYSMKELKKHLEYHFESWMNWNNYGVYKASSWNDNDESTWTWQIDHIIPHSTFKYTSMEDEEFKRCWSLDNLRPLSSKQNFLDGVNRERH
jgi:hypothetical protein